MKFVGSILALSLAVFLGIMTYAQPPAGGPPGGRGGSGRGGGRGPNIPGATPEQLQAIADLNTALTPLNAAVTEARNSLMIVTFSTMKNEPAINAALDKLKAAELALAKKRAEEFAKIQVGPNRLNPEQVTALIAAQSGGGRGGPGGPPPGGMGGPPPGRGQ